LKNNNVNGCYIVVVVDVVVLAVVVTLTCIIDNAKPKPTAFVRSKGRILYM